MRAWTGAMVALAGVAPAGAPVAGARLPPDTPVCAAPGTRPLFVAPMGEPFRGVAGQPYPSARWFAGADADRDGAVGRAEFVADARRFFRALDRNGDGRLVPDEVIAYERDVAPEIALYAARPQPGDASRARPRGEGGTLSGLGGQLGIERRPADAYGGPMGAGRYAWLNIPEPVASTDLDVDRVVSATEFEAAAARRFDALDALQKGGLQGRLRLADLPRTPAQVALEGPCRPPPKPRRGRARPGDRFPDEDDPR